MEINGKKVVDAKRKMRITITPRDAKLGKMKDPGGCAAARAILRVLTDAKSARVHLGCTYIEKPDKWIRYITPPSLKTEIVAFDRGGKAEYSAGDYMLYAPCPADRLGARPKSAKIAGKTSGKQRRSHIARVNHQIEGVRAHGANR